MVIDQKILDSLTEKAKASPRLRANYDLRNSAEDQSQRMMNAVEPGTIVLVHRHKESSETVVCLRGRVRELLYDENGINIEKIIELYPGGDVYALNIPAGQWHSIEVMESGTVILESKDGPYAPLAAEDVKSY